jgi:hypothetical protein
MKSYLQELLNQEKKEYVFRELTVIWKDDITNEYELYTSVILETYGWNRFDYCAFNYCNLPKNDLDVVVNILQMKEKQDWINEKTFLLDYSIWNPTFKRYKTKFLKVF